MLVPKVLARKMSAEGSHAWSLRMLALIVRWIADLWTPLEGSVGLWTTNGRAELASDGRNVRDLGALHYDG